MSMSTSPVTPLDPATAAARPPVGLAKPSREQAKAAEGGTPTRAPVGYLRKRDYIDGVLVSTVAVDPERAPLIAWAFRQYATG